MSKLWLAAIVPGILASIVVIIVVGLLIIKLLWSWTIPDLFPGAVEQGLIAAKISWLAAFKLALFIGILAGITGASRKR
jgi:TRAP-type C4-dicarboxylate transport system permease large subunit